MFVWTLLEITRSLGGGVVVRGFSQYVARAASFLAWVCVAFRASEILLHKGNLAFIILDHR